MVILSCGHVATKEDGKDGLGISVRIADMARDGSPAIAYLSVCRKCEERYRREGLIIENEEDYFADSRRVIPCEHPQEG